MKQLKQKELIIKLSEVDRENGIISATFSNALQDRHGEIVDQNSWILTEYLLNPVLLFGHDHYQPAIGRVENLKLDENGNLSGNVRFAIKEYDFANTIFNLYAGGFMSAFSVGFESLEPTYDASVDTVVLKQNVLYEISAVNVPANALALAKAKGIETQPVEMYLQKKLDYMEKQKDNLEKLKAQMEKEGRVLSKKNRQIIETAVGALNDVLGADTIETSLRTDKSQPKPKVVTPQVVVGGKKYPVWAVNKAIRTLLKSKANNK